MFVLLETPRHLLEARGKRIGNFRAPRVVDVLELLHEAADRRLQCALESLYRLVGAVFGALHALRNPFDALLKAFDRLPLAFRVRLLLDRLQRRLDGLRADGAHALFHLFEALGELRQRAFERLRTALRVFALCFLLRVFDAVRQGGKRLPDFGQRVVRAPFRGFEMIDDGVERLFKRLDRAVVFAPAASALGAFHAFAELLQFPLQRID